GCGHGRRRQHGGVMNELNPPAVVRAAADLTELARRINAREEHIHGSRRKVLEDYAAQGKDLLAVKENVGHGNWLKWLAEPCPGMSERKARWYMAWAESDVTSDLSDLDAAEQAWQRISGNAPKDDPKDTPKDEEEAEEDAPAADERKDQQEDEEDQRNERVEDE